MIWFRYYFVPLLFTVLLHGGLFMLLDVSWDGGEPQQSRVIKASTIKATVVELPKKKPKPKPKKPAPKPVQKKVEKKTEPKPQPVKKPEEKPPEPEEKKPEEPVEPEPIDLESELAMEEELLDTASDEAVANSYSALIAGRVEQRWSRPPSARNGMEVRLVVQLVPTGDVVNVTVTESSGNAAFDRSAVNAVKKVGQFPELQQLETEVFERYFRRFNFLFKPEDLRL